MKKLQKACVLSVLLSIGVAAQGPPVASATVPGWTSNLVFGGSSSEAGQVLELTTSVGYDFNHHFGVSAAVPFYFVQSSAAGSSNNGVGDPTLGMHFVGRTPVLRIAFAA